MFGLLCNSFSSDDKNENICLKINWDVQQIVSRMDW